MRASNRLRCWIATPVCIVERTLKHEGAAVRTFYGSIPPPVVVGIEATGSMGWFLRLMEELAIECRVGHLVAIRKADHSHHGQQEPETGRRRPLVSVVGSARWVLQCEIPVRV